VQAEPVASREPPTLLKPSGTGPRRSQFWSHSPRFEGVREDRTRPQLQLTDHTDLPRTHVRRLGKRVGRKPSRVRISYPPLAPDQAAGAIRLRPPLLCPRPVVTGYLTPAG
jgi:hypothetical protein